MVSITIKSYNQLKVLNLATAKMRKKNKLMPIKKVIKNTLVLGNYFRQLWFPWQQNNIISLNS